MALANRLGKMLTGGELICLQGDLGAGKTVFVRGLAEGLGCDLSEVSSPTYVLERVYPGRRLLLRHLDAYRLSGPEEFEESDLNSGLNAPDTVSALEWPGRVEDSLPAFRLDVRITATGENERKISMTVRQGCCEKLIGKLGG